MCKKFVPDEKLLVNNIDADGMAEWIEQEYEITIIPRYLKKLAVETKGCFKCFASRLQGKICNERFDENAKLYSDWPKDFAIKLKQFLQD